MMQVNRWWKIEHGLQKTVQIGAGDQVIAADDVGDALRGIVHHDSQMVAEPDIFSADHRIIEQRRNGMVCSLGITPAYAADASQRSLHIQSPATGHAIFEFLFALAFTQFAAGAGIDFRHIPGMRGKSGAFNLTLNVTPRAEAGINQSIML